MTPRAKSILFDKVLEQTGYSFDPRSFKMAGPDVYFFPDIDGCYAINRTRDKRGDKTAIKTLSSSSSEFAVCGPGGRLLGRHITNFSQTTGEPVDMLSYDPIYGFRRKGLSLENAVRFFYLSAQANRGLDYVYEHIQTDPFIHTQVKPERIESLVFSDDGSYFAFILWGEGYGIFDLGGNLVGEVPLGRFAQYFPIDRHDMIKIKMSDSRNEMERHPHMPTTFTELRPYLDLAFDFIKRCE